ncbi:Rv3654c family TadE-like protein [Rhizohabitans arisaemae]|uniref:Rv3654c family TadE-like protein n=1 Tax=Rhizohabitans arisaemae TaxID=2720610 RepID=UPI003D160649
MGSQGWRDAESAGNIRLGGDGVVKDRERERGSGTLWMLVAVGVVWTMTTGVVLIGVARSARHKAQTAADLSALAAAQSVIDPERACAVATEIAMANGARLNHCRIEGEVVEVGVTAAVRWRFLNRSVAARARAGPVPSGSISPVRETRRRSDRGPPDLRTCVGLHVPWAHQGMGSEPRAMPVIHKSVCLVWLSATESGVVGRLDRPGPGQPSRGYTGGLEKRSHDGRPASKGRCTEGQQVPAKRIGCARSERHTPGSVARATP